MSDNAFITMLCVLGIVWGGFAVLLGYALRREAGKRIHSDPGEDLTNANSSD